MLPNKILSELPRNYRNNSLHSLCLVVYLPGDFLAGHHKQQYWQLPSQILQLEGIQSNCSFFYDHRCCVVKAKDEIRVGGTVTASMLLQPVQVAHSWWDPLRTAEWDGARLENIHGSFSAAQPAVYQPLFMVCCVFTNASKIHQVTLY